jgi:HAD superfamily hydrolase (TIGR01509 family)
MGASAVLFDIDGTLVDSNYLHVEAWERAFHDIDVPVDAWRIHRSIGMDSKAMLQNLLGADTSPEAERAKKLHDKYYEGFEDRLRVFDGARELIRELARRGKTVVLATSAPENELANLRGVLKIEDSIAVVTSSEDVETAKPEPDLLHVALERAETSAEDAVMVGDSVWDVQAAANAGVRCIGLQSGGVSVAELTDAGAIAVYADTADLLAHLDESPLA